MSGLDVLAHARAGPSPPRVVMMTADDTPETLLQRFARQAHWFVRKPFAPRAHRRRRRRRDGSVAGGGAADRGRVGAARMARAGRALLAGDGGPHCSSSSCSSTPSCRRRCASRSAQAFRELLTNAIEWGGKLDPHAEGQDLLRAHEAHAAVPHRRSGRGIRHRDAAACGHQQPRRDPLQHAIVREEQGLRPGGLGLMMTRSLVDELIYNEKRNEVVLIKYLD